MLRLRLQTIQIHHVHKPHLQVRKCVLEDRHRRQRLHRHHIARTRHHHVRLLAIVRASPVPDPHTLRAVHHRRIHIQVHQVLLLVCHNHIHIILAAQAVVRHTQQAVRIRRQIDPRHLRALVAHHIQKSWVLVRKPVMILPPHHRRDQQVHRRNRRPPVHLLLRLLQPLRMLVIH